MTTATHPSLAPLAATAPFPSVAVAAGLRSELIETVKAEAAVAGIVLPNGPAAIASAPFAVDSLVVVSILCTVEPLLGITLPESVVRSGGYGSVDQALSQLLPCIESYWMKRKGGK